MRLRNVIVLGTVLVGVNVFFHVFHFRWDMTEDGRYSLSKHTGTMLSHLHEPLYMDCFLDGNVNASFRRLRSALEDLSVEMKRYAKVRFRDATTGDTAFQTLSPVVVHEKEHNGKLSQIPVYPYVRIRYEGKETYVSLLQNNRALSGEQNINRSIECLEYELSSAVRRVQRDRLDKVAFIDGHGELSQRDVLDWSEMLSRDYAVSRTLINEDSFNLNAYRAVIIAGGEKPYTEKEKYALDQYVMGGGCLLWLLDGARLSEQELARVGSSPLIANDLQVEDLLFKYGVRVMPGIVEDVQCLTVPVDVSVKGGSTNYQPVPYYAYPLLLTSFRSPITKGLSQVSAKFVSPIEFVGGSDGIKKEVLLASSTHSRVRTTPTLFQFSTKEDMSSFKYAYIPVAVSLEGEFVSFFAHRIPPQIKGLEEKRNRSGKTRQVVVGGSRMAKSYIVDGQVLPTGFDPYSQIQFGNRDFLINCVHFLCDGTELMQLRNKTVKLRLLNETESGRFSKMVRTWSIVTPLAAMIITFITVSFIRKRKYCYDE